MRAIGRVASSAIIGYSVIKNDEQNISNNAKIAVDKVLRERLVAAGFAGSGIRPERDADGDPILVVDVNYDFSDKPINSKITYGLATEVRKVLLALGETRFPHIRHHFQ